LFTTISSEERLILFAWGGVYERGAGRTRDKMVIEVEKSHHVLVVDYDKQEKTCDFIKRVGNLQ
jgi:hypothetical protein